ncbi:MAG: hypothetical protein LAO24_05310 [Acidobacteriia bacterium]|nr:hypothetical protein [Terriglobia bacterium]
MGRWHFRGVAWAVAACLLCIVSGCGGHRSPGLPIQAARINLSPNPSTSVQVGSILIFTASAQNASGSVISATFTYQSSDTNILNISPGGVGCAGRWDASFTICTPQGTGVVQVTASAQGSTSSPTQVFVHPPIDNIEISEVATVGSPPPACPGQQIIPAACNLNYTPVAGCLSPNQTINLQATAFSKGADVTSLVGPFTWSEGTATAVTVTPITSSSSNTPTNQAVVKPNTPGFTPVFATASGVSSHPYYAETCPVQCIAVELGASGSQTGGQTSFATTKGTAEGVTATVVDVQGCVVPKPALTWSSSQPASVSAASSCSTGTTCSVTTPLPGAGSVTASCTPPTCNVGFPQSVAGLNQPGQQPLVQPLPVYPVTAISGLVSGAASPTSVLATSLDCQSTPLCTVNLYIPSTTATVGGNPGQLPTPPNSLLFDLAGDKVYVGSNYGAQVITVASLGGTTNPLTALGTVTGKVLAVSPSGNAAIFSDTFHTPNQVYVVNAVGTSSTSTPFNISGAIAATFSPDGLKAFIIGCVAGAVPCTSSSGNTLYVYSALQSLRTIPLSAPASAAVFSSSGAFAFLSGGSSGSSVSVRDTCDNNLATDGNGNPITVTQFPAAPLFLKMVPAGNVPTGNALIPSLKAEGLDFFFGLDNTGIDILATSTAQLLPPAAPCPQTITLAKTLQNTTFLPVHIDLGQGTFNPIAFFVSPSSTLAYIVASDRSSVLVYNFNTNSVSGIPLANSSNGQAVSPVAASITVDGTLIYVAASDGTLHQLNTVSAADLLQVSFPATDNPFCPKNSTQPCTLNMVAVKP